ncbi:hypothetical protein EXU57_01100 [Segetibacter sp. 3557_3]|nr:hypothetical protein EXU57_01100 [Segetibacter sp. 3557_3]
MEITNDHGLRKIQDMTRLISLTMLGLNFTIDSTRLLKSGD